MIGNLKRIYANSFVFKTINNFIDMHFRKRLKNKDFTILCPNCIGGVIYYRLGLRFDSPTVNLMMSTTDFCYFLDHFEYYIKKDIIDNGLNISGIPTGIIKGNDGDIPDIKLTFVHYASFEEGRNKWNERKARLHRENTYVIMYDVNTFNEKDYNKSGYASEEDLKKFENFECKNKVLLTRNKNNSKPYAHYIKPNYKEANPLVYMTRDIFGLQRYEKKFDFVSFLNKE